jgi:hypothetical protein
MEQVVGAIYKALMDDEIREGRTEYIREARRKAEQLEWHFEDKYPDKLLHAQHPSEEEWMKQYRRHRWQPPTKTSTGRVYNFLQKIQQADDFKIRWETDYTKTGIAEKVGNIDNTLKKYVTDGMPRIPNLETWLFNVFLKTFLQDANAIVAVLPRLDAFIENPKETTTLDWNKPFPQTFESDDLIYEDDEFVIVEVEEWKDENRREWCQYLAITQFGLMLFRQVKEMREIDPFEVYFMPFDFPRIPVIKVGNTIYEEEDGHLIYDSVLAPCLPAWNEVLYRTDDLNILYAVHALPQKWALKLSPCKTCNGTGEAYNHKHEKVSCGKCSGSGRASSSPFGLMEINIDRVSAINPNPTIPPIPPAGYIERPTDAVKLFQEDIVYKEFQGLKAIGLEILGQIPSNQSGIAKEYDRKELNTFCFSVCVHLADVYERTCFHIIGQRYKSLFESGLMTEENVMSALPKVTIPTDFDVLTSSAISAMLSEARKSAYNPIIVNGLESDYVEKLYGENSPQKYFLKVNNALDPLPFRTTDEKIMLVAQGGCTKRDFVLSSNLTSFIVQLTEEDPMWVKKSLDEQRADVNAMADAKLAEINSGLVPLMDSGMA